MKRLKGLNEVVESAFLLAAFTPNSQILPSRRIQMIERLSNMSMAAQKRQWRLVRIQARKIKADFTKIIFFRSGNVVYYRRKQVHV